MTDYNDGQIYGWNGGKCPVHPKSKVNAWFRSGYVVEGHEAGTWRWTHYGSKVDIVTFQVITPYVEPVTVWGNLWDNCDWLVYSSEEMAKSRSTSRHGTCIRTAVPFREVTSV